MVCIFHYLIYPFFLREQCRFCNEKYNYFIPVGKVLSEFGSWQVLHIHLNQPRAIVAGCLQKKNSTANQKFLCRLQFIRH